MLQIAAIVVGVIAVVMGIRGLATRTMQLSRKTKLHGQSAVVAGVFTLLVGLGAVGFALVGIPLLLSR